MLLAELEIRHSRPVAPTRRVALGRLWLPTDDPPGPGGLLLAGIVAAGVSALEGDDEILDEVDVLIEQVASGQRIVQPRVRHRFQTDTVGLGRSTHRLVGQPQSVLLDIDQHGAPLPQVLGAIYAAGRLSATARPHVFRLIRRATRWTGGIDGRLVDFLVGDEAYGFRRRSGEHRDEGWALQTLEFGRSDEPARSEILRRFRELIREAHPDHGGAHDGAGERIEELTEAKRILVGS